MKIQTEKLRYCIMVGVLSGCLCGFFSLENTWAGKPEPIVQSQKQQDLKQQPTVQKPSQQDPKQQPTVQKPSQQDPKQEPTSQKPSQQDPKQEPTAQKPNQQDPKQEPIVQKPQTQQQRQSKLPVARQSKIGPQCQIGDQWVIETATTQASNASGKETQKGMARWHFKVEAIETIVDRDCYRVRAECLDTSRAQPVVTIWLDIKSGMLIRTTSQMPIKGQWSEFTETYISSNGMPVPVFGAIPALPVDMPVFETGTNHIKSLEPLSYETIAGPSGTKSLDELGFACEVNQKVETPDANFIKSLDDTLPPERTFKVEIRGANKSVNQVWAPGNPWPVYSNNGITESRLIDFTPSKAAQE